MHKLLARQVRQSFGMEAVSLAETARAAQGGDNAAAMRLLAGLDGFVARVGESYVQAERDLGLSARSLELSSDELMEANQRLRAELESRTRAMESLRATVNGLQGSDGSPGSQASAEDLESLSRRMAELVAVREESQRQLQAALAELAHQKFALDQHSIVSITDREGRITYVNDKFCQISGYSREELLGQNHRVINARHHPAPFFEDMWREITAGRVWNGEFCNRAKAGHLYWVQVTVVPLCDALGAPERFIAIRTEITERKALEAALKYGETRLRRITNHAPAVVFQCEVGEGGMRFTFISDRLRDVRGLDPDRAMADGEILSRQIVEADREHILRNVLEAAMAGRPWAHEFTVRLPDGRLRTLFSRGEPEPGNVPGGRSVYTGMWQDVTDTNAASTRLDQVTRTIPIAVFQCTRSMDGVRTLTFCSAALEKLCGLAPAEAMSEVRLLFERIHPADRDKVNEAFLGSVVDGRPFGLDFRMVHSKTLATLWVHLEVQPLPMGDGGMLWNGYLSDIGDARRVSQELRRAKEDAEAASRAKSDFLSNMSHEIRTPLNGVLGMAQVLGMQGVGESERRTYAQTLLTSGMSLMGILNDILDLSKIEAGRIELRPAAFSPAELLAETQALYGQQARAKGLALEAVWAGAPNRRYLADPVRVRQILNNLVSNALKFTPAGSVRIDANEVGFDDGQALLEFSVIDTGIGVPVDKIGLLFRPFAQLDGGSTRTTGGTGLGLSIVRSLAELMGGEAWMKSRPGKGSRVVVRIRAQVVAAGFGADIAASSNVSPAEAPAPALPGPADAQADQGFVLVVEDTPANALVLSTFLQKLGVRSVVVGNGREAVDLIASGPRPQMVLMDCQMPVMDGFEATGRIRALEKELAAPRLPVVALTASAFGEDRARCLAAGMDDFLAKPLLFKQVQALIGKWMPAK